MAGSNAFGSSIFVFRKIPLVAVEQLVTLRLIPFPVVLGLARPMEGAGLGGADQPTMPHMS
jgi:hypothetical protein